MTPDWQSVPLGGFARRITEKNAEANTNVLTISAQKGLVSQREYFNKNIASEDLTHYYLLHRGDFAYNKSYSEGYPIGAIKRLTAYEKGVVSPLYICFRVEDLGRALPDYLVHYFESDLFDAEVRVIAKEGARNHGLLNVKPSEFLALPVSLPPVGEQRKIAAILFAVDDAIERTQAVIDQLQVVKKAMMTELLTRGLPGRHTRFKRTVIGEVPEEWSIRPCGDLFDVQLGKMMSVQARTGAHQFPCLRNENVHWLRFDLSDVAMMHFDEKERAKFRLHVGDLLACEGRHIGRGAVWRGDINECYYQKALHRLRAKTDEITTDYMQFFMMLRFRHMTDLVAEANTTSTIPHFPRERLVALPVWYPPRAEQDEIAEVIESIIAKERIEQERNAALAQIKSALMSALLTGEIRAISDEATP